MDRIKRTLSKLSREEKVIDLHIEKSKLNREKALLILNKSFLFYFAFVILAVIGFVNDFLTKNFLNFLIFAGIIVLVIGTIPYIKTMKTEEKNLNNLIKRLESKRGER